MADPICPKGMVLQKPEGAVHPDEPAFYLGITEEPQKPFMDFLRARFPDEYREVSELLARDPLVKGDKKPAVYAKWGMARAYCAAMYPGGDLPTEPQWENGCGDKRYCTASGDELKHTEARFSGLTWINNGPGKVDWYAVNARGTKNQTGNAWEWTRYAEGGVFRRIRGGSWDGIYGDFDLSAGYRYSGFRSRNVGFRCVAPALSKVGKSGVTENPGSRLKI